MLITVLRLSDASSAQSASQRLGVLASLVRDRLLAVGVSAEAAALVQAPRARGGGWDCGDSGPLAARLAREEGGRRPGPGRDTLRRGTPLTGVGLESAGRVLWPGFGAAASAVGVRAVTTVALPLADRGRGVVVVYHLDERLVPEDCLTEVRFLAMACAQGLRHQEALRVCGQLEGALQSRVLIEQAKGQVSERRECTPDAAFALLRSYARAHQVALHEVARWVLDGTLTASPFDRSPLRRATGA